MMLLSSANEYSLLFLAILLRRGTVLSALARSLSLPPPHSSLDRRVQLLIPVALLYRFVRFVTPCYVHQAVGLNMLELPKRPRLLVSRSALDLFRLGRIWSLPLLILKPVSNQLACSKRKEASS